MISALLVLALAANAAPVTKAAPKAAPAKKAAKPAKPPEAPMEWKSSNGGPNETGHRVITDAKGWEALWRVIGRDAPALDLAKFSAVAVFVGERPTGGWGVVFDEPKLRDGETLVVYRIVRPKGFVTQAFTAPWIVKAYPKPAGKLQVLQAADE